MKPLFINSLCLLLICLPASLGAQQSSDEQKKDDRFRFNIAVETVNLDVVITDNKGRFIPGLTAADIEVFEDGTPQEITFFNSEVTPLTVLLLLDASTSIRPSVEGVKEAASNFVLKLWDGDEAIVADFNENLRFSSAFTEDVDRLVATIQSLYPSGWTALYDSIIFSLEKLYDVDRRKALLVFTDGDDSRSVGRGSEATRDDAIEAGRLSEVTIYSVGFQGNRAGGRGVNKGFLKKLSRETGGVAFFPSNIGELNRDFTQIQEELHSQYRLAYVPSKTERDGHWRDIEIKVKNRGKLKVRTRQGYYAIPRQKKPRTE